MAIKRKSKIKKQFEEQGREIANYINKDSPQNAQKFIKELENKIDQVEKNPTAFPPEPFLNTKNNLYRFAIIMKSWKVIFKTTNKLLVFLGIINTARHPKEIIKLRTRNYE